MSHFVFIKIFKNIFQELFLIDKNHSNTKKIPKSYVIITCSLFTNLAIFNIDINKISHFYWPAMQSSYSFVYIGYFAFFIFMICLILAIITNISKKLANYVIFSNPL